MASRPGTAGQRGNRPPAGTGPGRAVADRAGLPVQRTAGNRQRGVAVQPPAGSTAAAAAGETDGVCAGGRHVRQDSKAAYDALRIYSRY